MSNPDDSCAKRRRTIVDDNTRLSITQYYHLHDGNVKPREVSERFHIGFENCRKLLRQLRKGNSIMRLSSKKGNKKEFSRNEKVNAPQIQTFSDVSKDLNLNPVISDCCNQRPFTQLNGISYSDDSVADSTSSYTNNECNNSISFDWTSLYPFEFSSETKYITSDSDASISFPSYPADLLLGSI